jgi:hypothetical protein
MELLIAIGCVKLSTDLFGGCDDAVELKKTR